MKSVRLFFLSGLMLAGILGFAADTNEPDVLGIKIGMPVAEARLLVAGHDPKAKYLETKAQVVYPGSDARDAKVPGAYISGVANSTGHPVTSALPDKEDALTLMFTPTPGAERVETVARHFFVKRVEDQFSFDALKASFVTKYGKPSNEQDSNTLHTMLWRRNAQPVPREKDNAFMINVVCPAFVQAVNAENRSLIGGIPVRREFLARAKTNCGDSYLVVTLRTANPLAPENQRLADSYTVTLIGVSVIVEGMDQADIAIAADKALHDKENLERAKRNVPQN